MDHLKELIAPKTFNKISYAAVLIWFMISAVFFGIFAEVENSEERFDFRCGGARSEYTDLVRGKCFEKYEKQYNNHGVPIYGFVIINFGLIGIVCAMYSQSVRHTVDHLSSSNRNGDPETGMSHDQGNSRGPERNRGRHKLFIAYCFQLSTRLVLGILFIVLQTQWLYPLQFSSKFDCYFNYETNQPRNSSNATPNNTHECYNRRAEKKTFWMYAVLIVNGTFVAGILIETVYILLRAWKERRFMQDSEFLNTHIKPTDDKSLQELQRQEERREHEFIPHPLREREHRLTQVRLYQEPLQDPVVLLQLPVQMESYRELQQPDGGSGNEHSEQLQIFITKTKKKIKKDTDSLAELRSQFSGPPGEQTATNPPPLKEPEHCPNQVKLCEEPPRDPVVESSQEPQQPDGRNRNENSEQLQIFIAETKKKIKNDTHYLAALRSPFSGPPGEQTAAKHLTLDQIYTNLMVIPDRAKYPFTTDRQEQLKVYPKSRNEESQPKSLNDLLNDENKKVLVVGRPGIGKTLCCTKILRDWASNRVFNATSKIHFDAAFLVKFRRFDSENHLSLRELLIMSEHSPSNHLDDEVWKHILQHPENVLILFDGFDEFKHGANMAVLAPPLPSIEEKMSLEILYQLLVTEELLKDASVVTTTRPTALEGIEDLKFDKTLEILGFSTEQIKEYVYKFAVNDEQAGEKLWRHISSNMNLLSLCYIPVNSFIICSSLSQISQFESSASDTLPSKLTKIYKIALRVFYFKHTKEFRDKRFTRQRLLSDKLPTEVENKFETLGRVAYEGIKEGKLVLEGNEVTGMEDSALFHRLPDRQTDAFEYKPQFCFIHLTMQEFFAARHLVNTMTESELTEFVSQNIKDGKWQLVFQFLAGLMNDKENLPSEIITDLLPEETEKTTVHELLSVSETPREVTMWPTEGKRNLALTLFKCFNESDRMQSIVQRKLQQINFNGLHFISSHLTAVDCSSLVNVIMDVQQISHLRLSFNNLGPLGCFEICKLLKCRKSQLSWLDLTRNQLKDEGAKYLADAITNNNCQLRTLDLTNNNITDTGAQDLADAITNNNCQLHSLNLYNNNITDTGAQHLADAITNNNCQLHTLNLTSNNITDTGAQHLADAITNNNCQLRELDLRGNNITDTGAQLLADAITNNNCQLHTLKLSGNNITDTGAQDLADAITNNNCQLRELVLSHNNITEAGEQHARSLVSMSKSKCKLII
ncbi:NACHT, LRR and PYD domains-containing protein 3-like [Stylophora pistillata]|uniref:NACHT, LRR and PYD domains-containing protein 3-like n=1 Tax=Stylophora pistillata TaxID=50429 RepID=UPI000C03CE96|nr:NACHT, LRR and PYD domains-containing protein 3-like [Stylophora pistillata]